MDTQKSRQCPATILVVEDDRDIRESLQDALEMENYKVVTAENGLDGMEKLRTLQRPCLVLLDLMMPVMNGLQFLSACQEDDTLVTIPVVMVTAFDGLARTQAKGIKGIVKKPVDIDRLLNFVENYCAQHADEQSSQSSRETSAASPPS